ncbi:hypothetical protein Areg01_12340 [Actinoplanes regularis]|nr:hypothetical protein Areg01_12340 [Actinoplanes regularis]
MKLVAYPAEAMLASRARFVVSAYPFSSLGTIAQRSSPTDMITDGCLDFATACLTCSRVPVASTVKYVLPTAVDLIGRCDFDRGQNKSSVTVNESGSRWDG